MFLSSRYLKSAMSSSRFSARGRNQWRRGFIHESREVDSFVSGEDHVGEVRAANYGHRYKEFQQQFRPWRPSAPPFRAGPPPKSADHRNWIFAASQPAPDRERFKVLSYNILADYLALDHYSNLYFHIPDHILAWEWRKRRLFIEFGLWSPDIMCLQEVDQFCDLEGELAIRGYSGIWKKRTGNAVDGCAIFWRNNRFQLRHEEHIEFSKLGLRDNVAQICVLESKMGFAENAALALSNNLSSGANQVVVCNIHVLYNPKRGEIKLGQVRILLDRAFAISRTWNDAPVIVCGDFNSIPMSPLYKYISTQTLNLSGLARDQISGQYSATLRRPNSRYSSDRSRSSSHYASERTFAEGDCKTKSDNQHSMESSSPMEESAVTLNQDVEQKADGQMWFDAATLKLGEAEIFSHQEGEASSTHLELANMPNRTSKLLSQQSIICANVDAVEIREELHKNILVEPFSEDHKVSRGSGDFSDINLHSFQTDISNVANAPSFHSNKDDFFSIDSSIKSYDTSSEEKPCTSYSSLEVQIAENTEKSAISSSVTEIASSLITCENSCKDNGLDRYDFDGSHVRERMSDISCIEDEKIMDNMNPVGDTQKVASDKIIEELPTLCGNLNRDVTLNETSQTFEFGSEENADSNFFKELLGVEDDNHSMKDANAPNFELQEDSFFPITNVNFNVERRFYDPYCWSPMELEISSGNAKCTVLEHHLKLRSVYTDVEDYTGTKDSNREPQVTSYNQQFMGTVDYIWCSEDLHTVKVLDTIPKHVLQRTPGFPTRKWGSDHIALACELAFSHGSQNK